jgi:hypothetical protein
MDELIKHISQSVSQEQVDAVSSNSSQLSSVFTDGTRIMVAFNPRVVGKPAETETGRE